MTTRISLIIDLPESSDGHRSSIAAIEHASPSADVIVTSVTTDSIDDDFLSDPGHGVFIGPGTPYRRPEAAEAVARGARERGIPLVGT